jgi:uncharacterized protein (DUF2267 family)
MEKTMTQANGADLSGYYQNIQQNARLLRAYQAQTWSEAVLRTLSLNLDRGTKKKLGDALPDELAFQLERTFWLLHFRDKNKPAYDFLNEIARRGGNTDAEYARTPTLAVFREIKNLAGEDVSKHVADALAPELSELWQKA